MTRKSGHRISHFTTGDTEQGDPVVFKFNDSDIKAYTGESIAAALIASGILSTRMSRNGMPRGYYCGMGVCWECLVDVNGTPNQRACMALVEHGMVVRTAVAPKK
jgi:predicted molibdopterin-dependent oxidoreductase YjgC